MLHEPHSLQLDSRGNLYICDIRNHRIRKVDAKTGRITTFAGENREAGPRRLMASRLPGLPLMVLVLWTLTVKGISGWHCGKGMPFTSWI